MAQKHFLVIGNGPAANEAALTLREHAPEVRITMITKDREPQYKPHLLPELVAGNIAEDSLYVHPREFYGKAGIKLRLGQEVVAVDFLKKIAWLDHREVISFNGLIICTGGKPRIPEPLQVFEDLMLTLKTLADARTWIKKLSYIDSILVFGGDLTSLAFTIALLSLNKRVFFILEEGSLWPLKLSPRLREQITYKLLGRGVDVIYCNKVRSMARLSQHEVEVHTEDLVLRVGAVGAFFGLVPDVKFLAKSGLHIERGILVDEHLWTGIEGVYAAGDCAQIYHPELRDYWVSIGYSNAKRLGRVAALNLVGENVGLETPTESIFRIEEINVNTSWWEEF